MELILCSKRNRPGSCVWKSKEPRRWDREDTAVWEGDNDIMQFLPAMRLTPQSRRSRTPPRQVIWGDISTGRRFCQPREAKKRRDLSSRGAIVSAVSPHHLRALGKAGPLTERVVALWNKGGMLAWQRTTTPSPLLAISSTEVRQSPATCRAFTRRRPALPPGSMCQSVRRRRGFSCRRSTGAGPRACRSVRS